VRQSSRLAPIDNSGFFRAILHKIFLAPNSIAKETVASTEEHTFGQFPPMGLRPIKIGRVAENRTLSAQQNANAEHRPVLDSVVAGYHDQIRRILEHISNQTDNSSPTRWVAICAAKQEPEWILVIREIHIPKRDSFIIGFRDLNK